MARLTWPPATAAQVELLVDLRLPRGRREQGCCLIEGETLLGEALGAGLLPRLVAVGPDLPDSAQPLLQRAADQGASVVALTERGARRLSDREHAPGLLAAAPLPPAWDGALPDAGPALLLGLCGLQDPGNVGTLLRSALAFGASAALLLPGTADAFGPKVIRASAGAALRLPISEVEADSLVRLGEARRLQLVAAQPPRAAATPPGAGAARSDAARLPERCLLLLGHETRGVPPLPGLQSASVPHEAAVESLNSAMAGSILLADWYRLHRPVAGRPR